MAIYANIYFYYDDGDDDNDDDDDNGGWRSAQCSRWSSFETQAQPKEIEATEAIEIEIKMAKELNWTGIII